jgi:hypothetical protein
MVVHPGGREACSPAGLLLRLLPLFEKRPSEVRGLGVREAMLEDFGCCLNNYKKLLIV